MKKIQVALDGPSGSGKSSLAKRLSKELGLYYIDTGALYRTVGLYLKESGVMPEDEPAIEKALANCRVSFDFVDGTQRTMLDGRDVSGLIRTPEIAQEGKHRIASLFPSGQFFLCTEKTHGFYLGYVFISCFFAEKEL